MDLQEARQRVLEAFNDSDYYYNHQIPYGYTNFIDGMAWVGLLCGACHLVNDEKLAEKCEGYLKNLLKVGPDARNYAPMQVSSDWIKSETMEGYWYRKKPQAFAGPAALQFAIYCGAKLDNPFNVKIRAWIMRLLNPAFGYLVRWFHWFRQHIDSQFLAHLINASKPPKSMLWMCETNQFFSYIAGIECEPCYPEVWKRFQNGDTGDVDYVVHLSERKPSAWIFRSWPKGKYTGTPPYEAKSYTPTAQVVGEYLQQHLKLLKGKSDVEV